MAEKAVNDFATQLNGTIDSSTTTLVVDSAAPAGLQSGEFRVRVDSELMLVTAGQNTTSWTVTRAAEGSTAATHLDNAAVTHVLTDASFDLLVQQLLDVHVNDSSDAHDASAVSLLDTAGLFAAADVEGALAELAAQTSPDAALGATETWDMSAKSFGWWYRTFSGNGDITVSNLGTGDRILGFLERGSGGAHVVRIKETGGSFVTVNVDSLSVGDVAVIKGYYIDGLLQLEVPGIPGVSQATLDAHINDTTDAHAASAISILDTASDFTATDVEAALAELQTADEADEAALAAHIVDTSDAHDASAVSFSPTGTVAATDVQAAIAEVAAEAGGSFPAIYRVLLTSAGRMANGAVGATKYILGSTGGSDVGAIGTSASLPPYIYVLAAANHAVAGMTTKLRVVVSVQTPGTAPANTITFGLYPATAGSTVTPGTVVSGSTVVIATPASNSIVTGNSGQFTLPSDGNFLLGYVPDATPAVNGNCLLTARLEVVNV